VQADKLSSIGLLRPALLKRWNTPFGDLDLPQMLGSRFSGDEAEGSTA